MPSSSASTEFATANESTIKQNIYSSINKLVADRVPSTAHRILDVGCGTGALGQYLKQSQGLAAAYIIGITYSNEEKEVAQETLDEVIVADLNTFNPSSLGKFDCIICSHVLEHLYDPARILRQLGENLSATGVLIVALPNIVFFKQRLVFLKGRFRYEDGGLMDRTHYRFFDWETARELLEESGFTVTEKIPGGNFPLMALRRLFGAKLSGKIDAIALRKWPNMYGFQFVFVAHRNTQAVSDSTNLSSQT